MQCCSALLPIRSVAAWREGEGLLPLPTSCTPPALRLTSCSPCPQLCLHVASPVHFEALCRPAQGRGGLCGGFSSSPRVLARADQHGSLVASSRRVFVFVFVSVPGGRPTCLLLLLRQLCSRTRPVQQAAPAAAGSAGGADAPYPCRRRGGGRGGGRRREFQGGRSCSSEVRVLHHIHTYRAYDSNHCALYGRSGVSWVSLAGSFSKLLNDRSSCLQRNRELEAEVGRHAAPCRSIP